MASTQHLPAHLDENAETDERLGEMTPPDEKSCPSSEDPNAKASDVLAAYASDDESDRYLRSWRLAIVILSLCLGTFLIALDTTIIGVAVPRITTDFRSLQDIAWYGSAYLLTVTVLQPTFGNLYKFFNVKVTYMMSIVLFEAGSVLCAAAPNSPVFIVGRAVAGLGAAGLFQGALSIIGYTVTLEKRPLYMGIVISVFGISVCIGPVLGGAFTDHVSWRWCFWINLPIGGVTLFSIFAFLRLKHSKEENRALPLKSKLQHMDALGTVFFLGAICCLFLALQWGGQSLPWNSSKVIGLFVGFGLLIVIFGLLQWRRGENALIPLRVLRQRSIMMGSLFLFFLGMSSFVYAFYIPIYFQSVQGVLATASGVRFIALVLPQIVFTIISGALVTRWGYYVPYMVFGTVISIVAYGLLTTLKVGTATVVWAAFLVLCGIGMGTAMNIPYTALQVVLSESDIPTGNAIAVFSWQLGGALAVSISQTLFLNRLLFEVPRRTSAISLSAVVSAGASNLKQLASTPQVLQALRESYSNAVNDTLLFALVAACASLLFACGMERLNVKQVARQRRQDEEERNGNQKVTAA